MASSVERTVAEDAAVDADLATYRFTALRRGDYELYRGERGSADPILLVAPEVVTPASRKRLEHELSLGRELDAAWAAKPIRLAHHDGRPALVLCDPGGEPLDRLVGEPLDPRRFLRIAIALAEAIGRVHEQGLIHRDVKPANILLDSDEGKAWLTGFGVASRLARERQAPEPPSVISGTSAYMAPEQTGHMNRATDSRSDLYALGVTLYELMTGAVPFTTSDPIELIHSHIARAPTPPSAHPYGAPEPLSRIVMKLLAKAAEDRYQTAAGLEADLRRALDMLEATGHLEPFPLAAQDAPDRLLIPERLYGRERQTAALLAAFDRVAARGAPEVALVSGYSGIGKSSVVNELHKVIVLPRGIFISGKFDQRLRNIPFSTLAQAFQGLVRQILSGSDAEIGRWRDAILEAVGANGRLLTDLIPDLVRIIGPQPPVPELAAFDAQARLHVLFQRFIGVFARPEHPLVIFIDDLQWLDLATLERLEQIITNPLTRHVLLVGAYRDNEVDPDHPLLRTMASVRAAGVRIEELALGPISPSDVANLVRDALRCPAAQARDLARVIYRKTGGNPFFAVQFLTNLAEQDLIRLDARTRRWIWAQDDIDAQGFTDNLVDLMVGRLRRLPAQTQDALQLLACLGSNAEVATLQLVFGASEAEVHDRLRAAVQAEMIVARAGSYRFLHDRVQEAAYALIPEAQRASVHRAAGQRLLAGMTPEEIAERIFDVVNQLNLGAPAGAKADAVHLARINLQAGLKAKASTAYASACGYFGFGLAALGDDGWRESYDLAFTLLLERADSELVRGALDASGALIEDLLHRARSKTDRTEGFRLKITLQLLRNEMDLAVQTALECLKMYDMTFPEHPTREDVLQEYDELQALIGDRPIEAFIALPLMTDPEMRSLSTILETLGLSAYFLDSQLCDLLAFRNVRLALEHGCSQACALAFAGLGISLGPIFGRFEDGVRFVRVADAMCERHGFRLERTGTQLQLQMAVLWTRPIDEALQCLDAADRAAAETGEVVYACYSAEHRITNLLARGDALDVVWSESAKAIALLREKGYVHVVDSLTAIRQFISTLRGDMSGGASVDQATLLRSDLAIVHCFYWVLQLQLRCLMGDPAGALAAAETAKPFLWAGQRHIQAGAFVFYHALALAAVSRSDATDAQRGAWRDALTGELAALERLAQTGPDTYGHKHLLVAAELASLEGRDFEATRLYEAAVRTAAAMASSTRRRSARNGRPGSSPTAASPRSPAAIGARPATATAGGARWRRSPSSTATTPSWRARRPPRCRRPSRRLWSTSTSPR